VSFGGPDGYRDCKNHDKTNALKIKDIVKYKHMKLLFIFLIISIQGTLFAQEGYIWQSNRLLLDNDAIRRTIEFDKEAGTVQTTSMFLGDNERSFVSESNSLEFRFAIDDKIYSGRNKWVYLKHFTAKDERQGSGVTVTIRGTGELKELELDITYMLYPGLPVIRKFITFRNLGNKELRLESLEIENIVMNWQLTSAVVYANYAREKHLGTYIGNWDDPLVIVHDFDRHQGIALGNEAPGVTKRTAWYDIRQNVSIGLTHADQNYAFRKWLKPGESWESPKTFIALYDNTTNPWDVINSTVNDFTRKHMGIWLMELKEKPVFVYNTWNPFRHDINETLIIELADAAADCGIEEFIIDDGWQRNFYHSDKEYGGPVGDWLVNEKKFPNGLTPVFNYLKEKGMKPGLWLSLGSAHASSKVFREHKDWFVKDKNDNLTNLHSDWVKDMFTACYSTDWPDYIKGVITGLVKDNGLQYVKLDFSIVTSAYVVNHVKTGCYATNHPYHKDHNESYLNNFLRLFNMFDELHQEAPDLFIDCTFETMGKLQLIDYSTVKHAEGDWLSNFEEQSPDGALRVRNIAWWRTPVIPAGACVIGNLALDSKDLEFDFLSLVGTLPIMLGDPRKLPEVDRKMLKSWSDWLRIMQETYNYMVYRQDLSCFGEPMEGHWDGWARINSDTKAGGIIGVFRQGAVEHSRVVTVDWLEPNAIYSVFSAQTGENIAKMTGRQLKDEGFKVQMDKQYQGKLFEIKKL